MPSTSLLQFPAPSDAPSNSPTLQPTKGPSPSPSPPPTANPTPCEFILVLYIFLSLFLVSTKISHLMPHRLFVFMPQPPPLHRQAAPRYILHPCPHRSLACLLRAASRRVKALPLALISYLGPPLRAVLCRKIGLGGRLRTDF